MHESRHPKQVNPGVDDDYYFSAFLFNDSPVPDGDFSGRIVQCTGGHFYRHLKFWFGGRRHLASATPGTASFLFMSFVFFYTRYFFQMDGVKLIRKTLYYLALGSDDENLMLGKFSSVTRATLKGSMLIGILQGGLAGIAFAVARIDNAVFWGSVMAVLPVMPSVGSALIWCPACAIAIMQGSVGAGLGLLVSCGIVVGSLDKVLRSCG